MKILVIGATSFWGFPLVEELDRRGHEVSVFSRDPRAFPERWRHHLRCSFGEISHTHILHEAMTGVDRVMVCLSAGSDPDRAEEIEVGGTRAILEAATRVGGIDVAKLSSTAPLRQADWWPMAARRRADLIAETSDIRCCVAEMGWASEMLAPLRRGSTLVLPHPRSTPGRVCWQSRSQGVARLAELLGRADLPKRATLRGDDPATLAELSTRICRDHPGIERVFLPGRVFRWLGPFFPAVSSTGQRLIHAARSNETSRLSGAEDSLADWR